MSKITDPLVRPFAGLRPAAGRAAEVAAPPYDVVSGDEALTLVADRPYSFLHVSRAEIDLPPHTDRYSAEVYARAAYNLRSFEAQGVLVRDQAEAFYVYRMTARGKRQTGVAFSASIDAYLANRIRKHELTRPTKEDDRVRQIEAVDVITGPVLLVHRSDAHLAATLAHVCAGPADAIVPDLDGVCHELWVVSDTAQITRIADRLNSMEALYIADGHHRAAAATRVAAARRTHNKSHDGSEPYNGFLAVSFPDDEVTILDYNRLICDLNAHEPAEFRAGLQQSFDLQPSNDPVRPTQPQSFGMYLDGRWYTLTPRAPVAKSDPVERLDVRLLERMVLEPLLGIDDSTTNPRIDFVGGSRGPTALAKRIDSGEFAVGFTLFPTAMADLMAVADGGQIMPPKSTWFDPKLADGLISLPLI